MRKQQIFFILLMLLICNAATAHEYQFFKLKGALKELSQDESEKMPSPKLKAMNVPATPQIKQEDARREIAKKLLDLTLSTTPSQKTFKAMGAVEESDEKMSLLYQKINEILQHDYENIGLEQTGPLIRRHEFGGGILNFSGLSWQKPMGTFTFGVNRQIAPDLFSSRYIVHDTFVIGIDATTFLSSLKENDMIDISDQALAAFAGISFNRVYDYYHFADTYIDGIRADFSKLFLPFTKYNKNYVLNMAPYEIMKKKDTFTLNAGGVASVPIGYGLGFEAGVLAQVSYKRETTVQSLGPNDSHKPGEFLRVSLDKAVKTGADIHLALQIDFFNLLKLSILSYDLEYTYENSNKYALSFYESDKETLSPTRSLASLNPYVHEFEKILKGKVESPVAWHDHIVQLEQRYEENLNSKFSFLLLGKIRKKQTEKIAVIQDNIETVFFRHYSESLKFIQNFWSRLFNTAIFKIFKLDTGIKNAAEESKTLTIEYKHNDAFKEDALVENEEDFSIILSQEFSAASTHKWYQKKYKTEAINHLKDLTSLNADYATMLRREELRGPLNIISHLRVEKSGLRYFHYANENNLFKTFISVCGLEKNSWVWLDPKSREKELQSSQSGAHKCVKNLGLSYRTYINDFRSYGVYDLLKFKKFITSFFKLTEKHQDLASLFGAENVFLNGSFTATTKAGAPFQAYFKEGEFKGLGVIDNFTRQNGTANNVVNIIN